MKRIIASVMWILIIVGAVFSYEGISSVVNSKKTPVDFNSLKAADLQKNMIVEGDIECNFGYFEEEYHTTYGIKTGQSIYNFLITVGEDKYMGLKNQTEAQRITLEQQMNDTLNSLEDNSIKPQVFHFKGQIKEMTEEEIGFMKEYLSYMGYTEADIQQYMCTYYIQCVDYDGGMTKAGIGIALLLLGICGLVIPSIREYQAEKQNMQ